MSEALVIHTPQFFDRQEAWKDASQLWLASLRADSTRRAYTLAWRDLLAFTGLQPWEISHRDVARWVEDMRRRELKDCTRNLRMAGISSLYTYACGEYYVPTPGGGEEPLHRSNPAASKSLRVKISPYGKARHLSPQEARQVLNAIDRSTDHGERDFAMFVSYLLTGRRNSELRKLQWKHIQQNGGVTWYYWSGKGKKDQRYELPRQAWNAIKGYLVKVGRFARMQPDDYLFIASHRAVNGPLSMREVGRALKKYARLAGVPDPAGLRVHDLRHTAALLRKEAGDSVDEICRFLGHGSLAVTSIYLQAVEGQRDESQDAISDMLGL